MPYNTGNPQWDGALTSLSGALFPDPSKVAESYYYGAQARQAQINSAKTADQLAAMHAATAYQQGNNAAPTYAPGPAGTTIMVDPYAPSGLQPGAPGAAPSAPASPSMSATVTPQASQVPGAVPAPGGGHYVPPTMSPQQAGDKVTNMAQTMPGIATGPGALPTGSDGSTPSQTYGEGAFNAASLPTGIQGGNIKAAPANHDGSPQPVNFDFGRYSNLMAESGLASDQVVRQNLAVLGTMVKNGMPQSTGEQLAAFLGEPSMRNAGIGAASAANVANIGARSAANVATIGAKSAQTIAGMPVQFVVDQNDPTGKTGKWVPTSQLQTAGGTPAMNPQAAAQAVLPVDKFSRVRPIGHL